MAGYKTIGDLDGFHVFLNNLFLKHQQFLMFKKYDEAVRVYKYYVDLQLQHIYDEENLLLPAYKKLIKPQPPGGADYFYVREHEQIQGFLNRFSSGFENNFYDNLNIVKLFDEYYGFKHLLEHHHSREKTFLFKLLDDALPESKKSAILNKFVTNQSIISGEMRA